MNHSLLTCTYTPTFEVLVKCLALSDIDVTIVSKFCSFIDIVYSLSRVSASLHCFVYPYKAYLVCP